jgi:hypothetical protein
MNAIKRCLSFDYITIPRLTYLLPKLPSLLSPAHASPYNPQNLMPWTQGFANSYKLEFLFLQNYKIE